MFGLCTEIAFTGLWARWEGSFRGEVSLLMVPVYALAYVLLVTLRPRFEAGALAHPLPRTALLVLGIYAIEWAAGAAYAAIGLTPWHYDHGWVSNWSGGHVTLYYLPAWVLVALLLVPVAKHVGHLAAAAARRERGRASASLVEPL